MQNTVRYKGYYSVVRYDAENNVLYGKIEDIDDLVTFECNEINKVNEEFKKAVDDYLEMCRRIGKNPDKTYNGQFNVRIPPELHKKISYKASVKGISLNSYVTQAITRYLEDSDDDDYINNDQ